MTVLSGRCGRFSTRGPASGTSLSGCTAKATIYSSRSMTSVVGWPGRCN